MPFRLPSPRWHRARSRIGAAGAVLLLLAVAGCGSRLPERDFEQQGGTAGNGAAAPPITVGVLTSVSSPLGAEAFAGPRYGALAFFQALDAKGGLSGRQVRVVTCDDEGSGLGDQRCVRQLVDQQHVVALVATSVLDYAGASYVSAKGVPDIGGQPIDTAYDRYPHLYAIGGSDEPRDGRALGWNGVQYQTTEVYRYFRQKLGLDRAAVVAYNQADSARYAAQVAQGLRAEGYQVLSETVDFALPGFAAVAAAMKHAGTQLVLDALDTRGNVGLCQAMAAAGVRPAAKVTNVQNWSEQVRTDYAQVPECRQELWAASGSRNYEDTRYPAVAAFRDAMRHYYPQRAGLLSQWELEGWAAAQWFADAAGSCGAQVDSACLDAFMTRRQPYDAHGLLLPASFVPSATPPRGPQRACLDVARWQDAAQGGGGGWVTQVPDMDTNCFEVPALPYRP